MNNIRVQRTNADIFRVLQTTISQKMNNEHLVGVTVLSVETSSDLSTSRVHIEVSGDEAEKKRAITELEKSAGFLRTEIAGNVKMRQAPNLRFILDRGRESADRVNELLNQIKAGEGN